MSDDVERWRSGDSPDEVRSAAPIGLEPGPQRVAPQPLWKDFVEIFYAPRRVFERRRDGRALPAVIVVTVLTLVVMLITSPVLDLLQEAELARFARGTGMEAGPGDSKIYGVVGGSLSFPSGYSSEA